MYGGTFTVVRLGFGAYMHCPGNHWALVRLYRADLTEEERQTLRTREPLDEQDGVALNSSIGVLVGVIDLVITLVVGNWWWALGAVLWTTLWSGFLIRASR